MNGKQFAGGFGLGILVLPLSVMFGMLAGYHAPPGVVAFGALTTGAVALRPATGSKAAGVAAGILVTFAAAFGLLVWILSSADF